LAVNTSTALPHLIKEKTAMSNKFEQLLDYLVNEEMDKANELFHEIVVEKSREIYENMIAEEADEEELTKEAQHDDMDESMDDDTVEEETTLEIGGADEADPADGMIKAVSMDGPDEDNPSMDGDLGGMGDGSLEDQVFDLKSELEKLKADFAELSGDEASEPEHNDGENDPDFGKSDDDGEEDGEDGDEDGDEEKENMYSERMLTREYVEKVGNDWDNKSSMRTPGPVGSGTGDKAGQTSVDGKRSVVSTAKNRPTTNASAHNITQGGVGEGNNTGTSPNGKTGGLVGNVKGKFTDGGIHNVDGVKSGVKTLKGQTGWPNNNKSAGPVGSGSGDKAGQTSVTGTKSILDKAQ
jgi:hypothetical protein